MTVRKKNTLKVVVLLFGTILCCFLLFQFQIIDIGKIRMLEEGFQYNAISLSAIIGGFLFTGLSVFISVLDRERIKRLWNHHYLDNLYQSAIIGMIANVLTIVFAVVLLCCTISTFTELVVIHAEITALIIGIVFFVWCIKQLTYIISAIKEDQDK